MIRVLPKEDILCLRLYSALVQPREIVMAIEQVKYFYERLSSDQAFYKQLQFTASKAECKQVVASAGYIFTDAEFEDYTARLLDTTGSEDYLESLDEKELAAVLGGAASFTRGSGPLPPYGHSPGLYSRL
jgi:predicted ribosomally synthesized peptide with nif11-like leader